MQTYHRVHVQLGKKDRQQIVGMLNKGRESARVLRRALILRQLNQGQTAAQVAGNVGVAPKTMRAIARRYAGPSQRIIAMVCSEPPAGQARWSVRLIAQEAVRRKLVPKVGRECIRILLKSHDLKPWRKKKLVRGGTEAGIT